LNQKRWEVDQKLKRQGLERNFHWKLQRNTLAEQLGPRQSNMSQNYTKTTSLMTSLTNNSQPPTKNFFLVQTVSQWAGSYGKAVQGQTNIVPQAMNSSMSSQIC